MSDTPDAAMLWARERAADNEWPQYAEMMRAGQLDDLGDVSDFAEAHRAGQAHYRAELLAKLRLRAVGSDGTFAVALGEVIRMIEEGGA